MVRLLVRRQLKTPTQFDLNVTTMMSHMYSFGVPAQLYKEDRLKLQQARYEARFTPPRI